MKNGWALRYASPRLRDNYHIVAESSRNTYGNTLKYASTRFKNHRLIRHAVVTQGIQTTICDLGPSLRWTDSMVKSKVHLFIIQQRNKSEQISRFFHGHHVQFLCISLPLIVKSSANNWLFQEDVFLYQKISVFALIVFTYSFFGAGEKIKDFDFFSVSYFRGLEPKYQPIYNCKKEIEEVRQCSGIDDQNPFIVVYRLFNQYVLIPFDRCIERSIWRG
jgi:hypothetical protein